MRTGAVIVAAGMSSRMGEFKPLKIIGTKAMIEHVIDTFKEAGVDEIVLVTGRNGKMLKEFLRDRDITIVHNKAYQETEMFDSAKKGLFQLIGRADKIFFTPGDIPLFTSETVKKLLKGTGKIIKPVFEGRGGHPLLLDSSLLPALCSYNGEGGMKGAIDFIGETVCRVDVPDQGILMDADTKEDYVKLVEYYSR